MKSEDMPPTPDPEKKPLKIRGADERSPTQLSGEFIGRIRRMITAYTGYDVAQNDTAFGAELDPKIGIHAVIASLDAPPFRKYAQSFSVRRRVAAAGAGNFNLALLFCASPDDGDIAIVDWFDINGGASEWEYGYAGGNATPGNGVYAIEQRAQKRPSAFGTGSVPGTPVVAQLGVNTGNRTVLMADAADADIFGCGANLAGDMKRVDLADVIVAAGLSFFVQQLTANLALNVTFHGRFFRLGKELQ